MTRVLLTILAHHDLPRLGRAVRTARLQHRADVTVEPCVVINSLDTDFERRALVASAEWGVRAIATESNGHPGRGKNACLDAFLDSDCDYLTQLDGDDWLYPTWARSVAEHLRRAPALDAVALVPIDCVGGACGHTWTLPDGVAASVWTDPATYPWPQRGPGPSDLWTNDLPICPAMIRLISRDAALRWRFDEDLAVGEDHLMSFRYLSSHIAGELQYWISMAIDWMVIDRTTPASVQTGYPQAPEVPRLRELAREVVRPGRSSHAELPILYPPPHITVAEKRHWIDHHHIPTSTPH